MNPVINGKDLNPLLGKWRVIQIETEQIDLATGDVNRYHKVYLKSDSDDRFGLQLNGVDFEQAVLIGDVIEISDARWFGE